MLEPVIPMQPVQVEEAFDDPSYVYQVKWDGVRVLAYLDETGLRLVNRRLNDRTGIYPEFQSLTRQLCTRSAILDGEIVALGADGKPSFSNILRRDLVKNSDKVRLLQKSLPVYYMVFDLLYADDEWVLDAPWSQRQERLSELLEPSEQVMLVDNHVSGTELFRVMKEREMEGIVAKQRTGTYKLGEYSETWKKIKYKRTIYAVVGGVLRKGGLVNSLLLGLYHEGQLVFIGKAGSGLNNADIQALSGYARSLAKQECPFVKKPKVPRAAYDDIVYVPPQLVVEVNFAEWTSDLTLRQPAIQGFAQRDPKSCVFA